jgi:hypothetical protein
MSKVTRFRDIKPFTRDGSWECDYGLQDAVAKFAEWESTDRLNLDPDFQRAHVWTEAQQIAWIEFFLRGGKTGRVIYLNHPGWMRAFQGEFVIVDGKQRVQAARRFLNNEIRVFGSYFSEYTDKMPFSYFTLKINVNTLQTRAEVLQWYLEFNSGGTPHTQDELDKVRRMLQGAAA